MALAHHMIVVIHQVLSRQEEYVEFGGDYYDRRNKPRTVARLVMRLSRLGYQVDLKPVDSLAPAHFSMTEAAPQEASEKAIPKLEASGVRHVEDSGGGFGPCDFGDAGRGVRCWRRGRTGGTHWRAAWSRGWERAWSTAQVGSRARRTVAIRRIGCLSAAPVGNFRNVSRRSESRHVFYVVLSGPRFRPPLQGEPVLARSRATIACAEHGIVCDCAAHEDRLLQSPGASGGVQRIDLRCTECNGLPFAAHPTNSKMCDEG